jgi:hypothetical protein
MGFRRGAVTAPLVVLVGACASTSGEEERARQYLARIVEAQRRAHPDDAAYYELLVDGGALADLHRRRAEFIRDRIRELGRSRKARVSPVVGIVPSTKLQAEVVDVPGSDVPLVLLSSGMLEFLVACASVSSRTVMLEGEPVDDEGRSLEHGADYLLQLVVHHMFREGPYELPATSARDLELFGPVLLATDLFLVAHEYAHVVLEHGDQEGMSWHREVEADLWALEVVRETFPDAPWAWLGPAFYMALQDMFDDADKIGRGRLPEENREGALFKHAMKVLDSVRSGGEPVSNFIFAGVHPPTWVRRDYLLQQATSDFLASGRQVGPVEEYMLAILEGHEALWVEAQLKLIEILQE